MTAAALLSRADLLRRWRCGSHAFFQRAEADGLLVARRNAGRPAYRWHDVWDFEGGQPPVNGTATQPYGPRLRDRLVQTLRMRSRRHG